MTEAITLTAAYLLDLAIGDPGWIPHPVRGMGWMIVKLERALRDMMRCKGKARLAPTVEKLTGIVLVIMIVGATYGIFYFINHFLLTSQFSLLASYLSFIILAVLIATTIATHELTKSAQAVINEVKNGDLERARGKLGMIVGRDTQPLDQKGVLKATIETLAENASDGVIAPLFYFAIGGLPLAMAYKAVNTLDSMVGYKNEKYKNFGWAAARLDDIANYIPARITGILISAATLTLSLIDKLKPFLKNGSNRSSSSNGLSGLNSLSIMLRDGRKHSSPNSGVPEAAMAGALGVRLGGPSIYSGTIVEKPFIGEEKSGVREQPDHLYINASENAVSIVKITSLLGLELALILQYLRTAI